MTPDAYPCLGACGEPTPPVNCFCSHVTGLDCSVEEVIVDLTGNTFPDQACDCSPLTGIFTLTRSAAPMTSDPWQVCNPGDDPNYFSASPSDCIWLYDEPFCFSGVQWYLHMALLAYMLDNDPDDHPLHGTLQLYQWVDGNDPAVLGFGAFGHHDQDARISAEWANGISENESTECDLQAFGSITLTIVYDFYEPFGGLCVPASAVPRSEFAATTDLTW